MSVPSGAVPQLVLNSVVLLALLAYLPRALKRRKLRFAVIVLIVVVAAALVANLNGVVLKGPLQGGGSSKA